MLDWTLLKAISFNVDPMFLQIRNTGPVRESRSKRESGGQLGEQLAKIPP